MDKSKILDIARVLALIDKIKKNSEELKSVADSYGEFCLGELGRYRTLSQQFHNT